MEESKEDKLTIFNVMKDINDIPLSDNRLNYAIQKYFKSIPYKNIIEFLLVAHCSQYNCFKEYDYIDLKSIRVDLIKVTSKEIFSLLKYAEFNTLDDESEGSFSNVEDMDLWKNGTWSAPVIAIKEDENIVVIDGNNRLRLLRMYLKYSNKIKSEQHDLYLINSL